MGTTPALGTPGYIDPGYANTGVVSPASDVFSLGVIMLELFTGLPAYNTELVETGRPAFLHAQIRGMPLADQLRMGTVNWQDDGAFLRLALACTHLEDRQRPSAAAIVEGMPLMPSNYRWSRADCIVCMERRRSNRLAPCHHAVLCDICAAQVLRKRRPCPICRCA